eukprot:5402113-Amphidinium_carterae.1
MSSDFYGVKDFTCTAKFCYDRYWSRAICFVCGCQSGGSTSSELGQDHSTGYGCCNGTSLQLLVLVLAPQLCLPRFSAWPAAKIAAK